MKLGGPLYSKSKLEDVVLSVVRCDLTIASIPVGYDNLGDCKADIQNRQPLVLVYSKK